jgi:hypothetical protein
MKLPSFRFSSRGQVLPLAIMLLVTLLIMVPLMVVFSQTEAKWSVKESQSTQAMHLAEAGIEKAYLKISVSTLTWVSLQAGGAAASAALTNYKFDKSFADLDGGTYSISITSGPGTQQATIISVGRSLLKNEARAIKSVYANSPLGGISIFAGRGAQIGGGVNVEWGGVASPYSVDSGGRNHPQFWSASSIVGKDTDPNPPNCDSPNCCQWHSYYSGLPPSPTLDLTYYASSAAASSCAGLSLSPGVATPAGSCYYAVAQTNITGAPNTQGQTIFINGDATIKAPGIDIVGNLIVTGNLNLPNGVWGNGSHAMSIPSDAWKQYCNDWAAYRVFDPGTVYTSFPGLSSSYAPTGLSFAGTGKTAVYGLLYVGGNFGGAGGGGQADIYGVLYSVGSSSETSNSGVTFYYDAAAASNLQTTAIILNRISWQDTLYGWPAALP